MGTCVLFVLFIAITLGFMWFGVFVIRINQDAQSSECQIEVIFIHTSFDNSSLSDKIVHD